MSGREPVRAGTDLWRHVLESSALVTAGALLLAWLLPSSVPLWMITGTGMVTAGVTGYAVLAVTRSPAVAMVLAAWGLTIAFWLTAARLSGPWHSDVLAGLLIPAVILAVLTAVAIAYCQDGRRRQEREAEDRAGRAELHRWESLLERVGVPGVTVTDVHEHDGGLSVRGRLPKARAGQRMITLDALKDVPQMIAQHKRLPKDAVYVEEPPGGTAADFVLHVRSEDSRREIAYLPAENRPATVNRMFGLGVHDDNREYRLLFREVMVLIAGLTGSGKSNLLNVFLAQFARCADVVIWMIDLKGGRAARPWMVPWIQGYTDRPVIDWLATTREEADLMLTALWAAREHRSRAGSGGEKIIPSTGTPAIALICDEMAVATGHGIREGGISNYALARKIAQIAETGRSEAIGAVLSAVRPDVETMGLTAAKAMSRVRIGMAMSQSSDGQSLFPDDPAAAAALTRITAPGDGLVKAGRNVSPPVHFYRITDGNPDDDGRPTKDRITPIALWSGDEIRPDLEPRLVTALGEVYSGRWEREHGQALKREWAGEAGVRLARPEASPGGPGVVDPEFESIVSHSLGDMDPEKPVEPRRARLREILRQHGYRGASVAQLEKLLDGEGNTVPRQTIHAWLADDEKLGLTRRGGKPYHRWTWRFPEGDD